MLTLVKQEEMKNEMNKTFENEKKLKKKKKKRNLAMDKTHWECMLA